MNRTSSPVRRLGTAALLAVGLAAGSFGIANAQTTSTSTSTATTLTNSTSKEKPDCVNGRGGFAVHAPTIAAALGITTTELQTQLSAGQTVAQIATVKGVSLQKIIDAYVAEEMVEHPELTKADVVQRVTDRLNGVRPARPANADGTRPAKGNRSGSPSTTVAAAAVSA